MALVAFKCCCGAVKSSGADGGRAAGEGGEATGDGATACALGILRARIFFTTGASVLVVFGSGTASLDAGDIGAEVGAATGIGAGAGAAGVGATSGSMTGSATLCGGGIDFRGGVWAAHPTTATDSTTAAHASLLGNTAIRPST